MPAPGETACRLQRLQVHRRQRLRVYAQDTILPDDLPPPIRGTQVRAAIHDPTERTLRLSEVEHAYIRRILEKTGGNKYHTAQVLGIDRKTLYRKLAEMDGEHEATS